MEEYGGAENVILTRLGLGHCCLASSLKVIGEHVNGWCECGESGTVGQV